MKKRILTGDRPTGPLHLGHYFGSLQNRAKLQDEYETFVIIADWQVLYDHLEDEKGRAIEKNIREVLLDNISVGLDPEKVTFFVQSEIPELAELTQIFQFLVTVARAKRNPTIRSEMVSSGILSGEMTSEEAEQRGFSGKARTLKAEEEKGFNQISCGFLTFPISQAADILLPKADLVPVGEDQLPHIEQTREVARKFNRLFGETFPEPEGLVSKTSRMRGLDGNAKMSKSLGNVINLSATREEVEELIKKAYSGENHALFEWGELFGVEKNEKMSEYKPALAAAINEFLEPIRKRRAEFEKDPKALRKILDKGRGKMRKLGQETMKEVYKKMGMIYKLDK